MDSIASRAATTQPAAFLAKPAAPLRDHLLARLHPVRDPYTGLSIVQLGIVENVEIDGQHVVVICRYPQAWYSNSTSLALAAKIHEQLATIAGGWTVDVVMLSEGGSARHASYPAPSLVRPRDTAEPAIA